VDDELRDEILSIFEAVLDAQLRAVRRLRRESRQASATGPKSKSQVDMAYEVLQRADSPLHVSELIERIGRAFGVEVNRESLVSALTKKVARKDRFTRSEKNTFALLPRG